MQVSRGGYDTLVPTVEQVVAEYGSVKMLCDMRDFRWEKVGAWGADLRFGREFTHRTTTMAVVGDSAFDHVVAELARPFYAEEVTYLTDVDEAWSWLESDEAPRHPSRLLGVSMPLRGTGHGNDSLSGDAGPNTLFGNAGDDVLRGEGGGDSWRAGRAGTR